jgi:hypothetical protein
VTHALLWYPLAALSVTVGIGVWAWNGCSSAPDRASCREAVVPGSLLLLTVLLVAGLTILAVVWITARLLGPVLRRAPSEEEAGWAPHGAGWPEGRRPSAGAPEADDHAPDRVTPSRSRRRQR